MNITITEAAHTGDDQSWEKTYSIILDGAAVGLIEISSDIYMAGDVYVDYIQVDDGYTGRGIGTAALKALCEEVGRIYLAPSDDKSQRLYARLGTETDKYEELGQGYGVYTISALDF